MRAIWPFLDKERMEAYRGTVSLPFEAGEHKHIEYALDGSSWQSYHAPVTIGDGIHTLRVRAFDAAGNVTEHTPLTFQVDGAPPCIWLSDSWYIWESGELKVSDGQSGLSSVDVTAQGRP